MKTRDILITVTRTLPGWHVYNDRQFGRITAFDPQAGYEITVNIPDSDTIRIVRTQYELEYELVEDETVLDTADMGEEQALDELSRLLAAPMPRTDRLIRLKERFGKTAEWCRNALGDEQEAKDIEDMAEHYMRVCESCNNHPSNTTRCPCSRGGCWARSLAARMRRAVMPRCTCCPPCIDWTRSEPC